MCLNKVTLIGYAGDVPKVLKETKNGKFVRFSLATTLKYTDKKVINNRRPNGIPYMRIMAEELH